MKVVANILTKSLACLAVLGLMASGRSLAASWQIDSSHAQANFKIKHLMISNVHGKFSNVTGVVDLNDTDLSKSTVEAKIDATTINTNNTKRDEHLRSPDFFDTNKFPEIVFKSTKVEAAGAGALKVSGNLTLHGITKPIVLEVDGPTAEITDPQGNKRRGFSARAKIARKDFGISWNKPMDKGGVVLGEDVAIEIEMEVMQPGKK